MTLPGQTAGVSVFFDPITTELQRITLYTGNDDHIVADLALPFLVKAGSREATLRFRGGLLGHWSVWVKAAVDLLDRIHALPDRMPVPSELLALDAAVTDCNAAVFDVDNEFHGCIAGCHYILKRQGLMRTIHCLDPREGLSPGQAARIDDLYRLYPHLTDDDFVATNLARWQS